MLLDDMVALYPPQHFVSLLFASPQGRSGGLQVSGSFINELHDRALPPPCNIGTAACQSLATKLLFEKRLCIGSPKQTLFTNTISTSL